jgi:hypothetical protein
MRLMKIKLKWQYGETLNGKKAKRKLVKCKMAKWMDYLCISNKVTMHSGIVT